MRGKGKVCEEREEKEGERGEKEGNRAEGNGC